MLSGMSVRCLTRAKSVSREQGFFVRGNYSRLEEISFLWSVPRPYSPKPATRARAVIWSGGSPPYSRPAGFFAPISSNLSVDPVAHFTPLSSEVKPRRCKGLRWSAFGFLLTVFCFSTAMFSVTRRHAPQRRSVHNVPERARGKLRAAQ